ARDAPRRGEPTGKTQDAVSATQSVAPCVPTQSVGTRCCMLPRISVVTSSYNQGRFLGRTIDSVLAQDYPNLEHIVVDGMSADETPAVLARYPHLRVLREKDRGQADAINKGFRLATGDVYCFLNSDDTFLPGALHRVAREVDP